MEKLVRRITMTVEGSWLESDTYDLLESECKAFQRRLEEKLDSRGFRYPEKITLSLNTEHENAM